MNDFEKRRLKTYKPVNKPKRAKINKKVVYTYSDDNMNFIVVRKPSAKDLGFLFKRHHYLKTLARGCPDVYELINPETGEIIGAAQVGIPATRHIDRHTHKEIRRFVLIPGVPKNTASFFISRIIKDIRLRYAKVEKIIAYSDPNVKHKGTIYLASNFKYIGQGKHTQSLKIGYGKYVHLRTAYNKNKNIHFTRKELNIVMANKNWKSVIKKGKLKFEYQLRKGRDVNEENRR